MYSLHHIGVFPSIYPEAFGITGAEIQASGLALVSSGIGGAAELIEKDCTGLQFKAGNGKDLAEKLRFKSFNWAGPLSNLLVQDFKNISSFETLGPFRFYVDRKLTGNECFFKNNSK